MVFKKKKKSKVCITGAKKGLFLYMVYHFYADDTQIYFFASLGVRVQESSTKRVFSLFALVPP